METVNLRQKMFKVQQSVSVQKDWANPFFKSKYITLDMIVSKLNPLLDEHKLAVIHRNIENWVITEVHDLDSNIHTESTFIVPWMIDPQKLWSVITYGRRYNLVSLFNIIADEDDDWNSFYDKKKETSAIDRSKFTMTNLRKLDATLKAKDREPKTWDELITKIKTTHYIEEAMMSDLLMYKKKRWLK